MNEEKFHSPANRVLGSIGASLGLAAIVAMLVNDPGRAEFIAIFAISGVVVLSWAFMIRPLIRLTETTLTLRNPLVTVSVPLQLVRSVEVRRYTIVELAEGRLTSTAMARGLIDLARSDRDATDPANQAGFMVARINARKDEARAVPLPEGAGVRRTPAWPEIALLVISVVGLVVTLLL